MKKLSQLLSAIFSPILIPSYGVTLAYFLTILSVLPIGAYFTMLGAVVLLTCFIPIVAIFALYKLGYVSDAGLNNRTERTLPYILTILCYLAATFFLWRAGAPSWLSLFFTGGAAAAVVSMVVNRWWKISAHAAAMGGLIGLIIIIARTHYAVADLNLWFSIVVLCTGAVMTARVYLGRHTLLQVLAGALNGILCVTLIAGV